MADFPHLKIKQSIEAKHRSSFFGGNKSKSPTTLGNLNDRSGHGENLLEQANTIIEEWEKIQKERLESSLPPLPDAIPLFLRIDPKELKVDSLRSFGIEVISVEDDGVIIGSSMKGELQLVSLKEKIQQFLTETGRSKDQIAQLWEIEKGKKWRIENILSDELQEKWDSIEDNSLYILDVGISCNIYISDYPNRKKEESEQKYSVRIINWRKKKEEAEKLRDEIAFKRHSEFEKLVRNKAYNGDLLESFIDFGDSFGTRIKINGLGLKDIVLNYPYLFEINEYDPYEFEKNLEENTSPAEGLNFNPPPLNAPKVCLIDSGVQEGHRFLVDAIISEDSKSYIPDDPETVDKVGNGGHGTRVAGAILFSNSIPKSGTYSHSMWIQNARVLDRYSNLAAELFPASLMKKIVEDYFPLKTKIFNLSINSQFPCKMKHMSDWSASIDKLIWEKDVLFIISAGNLRERTNNPSNLGIKEHLQANRNYPNYLTESSTRIANPAQSFFSLTVGSVCNGEFEDIDRKSFGTRDQISSFSRTGLGIWDSIKPDVVEYGGDWVREKNSNPNLTKHEDTSPELTSSTLDGQPAIRRDAIGTSFAAPKVSHIVAKIQSKWQNASSLFLRALVAQSARWSEKANGYNPFNALRYFGYGLPSLARALDNSKSRITFVAENKIQARKAHIYSFQIPEELRNPADTYDFLLEVTLAYKAKIRRTRKGSHSYVATWVDWVSGKLGESEQVFKERVTDYTNSDEEEFTEEETPTSIKWTIRERKDWGLIRGVKRNDSSLQKDWVILKSYDLPASISFAVVGHKGWEKDLEQEVPYCMFISLESLNPEIPVYEKIRIENQVNVEIEI